MLLAFVTEMHCFLWDRNYNLKYYLYEFQASKSSIKGITSSFLWPLWRECLMKLWCSRFTPKHTYKHQICLSPYCGHWAVCCHGKPAGTHLPHLTQHSVFAPHPSYDHDNICTWSVSHKWISTMAATLWAESGTGKDITSLPAGAQQHMPWYLSVTAVVSKGWGTVLRHENKHCSCENISPCIIGSSMFAELAMCKRCARIWLLLKMGVQVCRCLYYWQDYQSVCGEGFYTSCCSRHCIRNAFCGRQDYIPVSLSHHLNCDDIHCTWCHRDVPILSGTRWELDVGSAMVATSDTLLISNCVLVWSWVPNFCYCLSVHSITSPSLNHQPHGRTSLVTGNNC